MNILTVHGEHTRLRRRLRSNYTADNVQKYMDHAHHYSQLRITLYTLSEYALGLLAVTAAAYNVLHIWNGDSNHISIIEVAFPLLATAFATHLHHTNKNLNTKHASDTINDVNTAKHINELKNRDRDQD